MESRYPKILAIITGKGPLKGYYIDQIKQLEKEKKLSDAHVHTAWFEYGRLRVSAGRCRPWDQPPQVILGRGSANEGGRHVWSRVARGRMG